MRSESKLHGPATATAVDAKSKDRPRRRVLALVLVGALIAMEAFPAVAEAHGPVAPIATSYPARLSAVPAGLDAKVVDGDLRPREREHQQRLAGLSRKQAGLVKLDRQRERHLAEYRRLVDEGSSVAHLALEVVAALDRERDQQQEAIGMAEAVAGEWSGTPDLDSMLEFYAGLVDLVRGKVSAATEAKALNATLASVIAGVWLEIDGDRLRAEFRLNTAMFIDPADAEDSVLATGFTLTPVADHQITRPLAWLAKPTDRLPSRSCPPA
jgi:hypothetical protein